MSMKKGRSVGYYQALRSTRGPHENVHFLLLLGSNTFNMSEASSAEDSYEIVDVLHEHVLADVGDEIEYEGMRGTVLKVRRIYDVAGTLPNGRRWGPAKEVADTRIKLIKTAYPVGESRLKEKIQMLEAELSCLRTRWMTEAKRARPE